MNANPSIRNRQGFGGTISALAAVAAVGLVVAGASPIAALATPNVEVERLGGATRYETAVRISQETFPTPYRDAWLARGDLFPDALAASYAAKAGTNGGAPILLTPPDELHPAVRSELERLGTEIVYIAGDSTAISHEVETELQAMGITTNRAPGADRFATARSIAATAPNNHYGTAIVATGFDFADAIAAGPLAYAGHMPVLLTTPDRLHEQAAQGLREQGVHEVIIVGGTSAVSDQVRRDLEQVCFDEGECIVTRRIGGRNRTETAALVADEFVQYVRSNIDPSYTASHVNLARGDAFPDATAGGPHGGEELAPVLLTADPNSLSDATRNWLEDNAHTIDSIHVMGTRDAVSDEVVEEAREAASTP